MAERGSMAERLNSMDNSPTTGSVTITVAEKEKLEKASLKRPRMDIVPSFNPYNNSMLIKNLRIELAYVFRSSPRLTD
ncbi:hypothetical protein RND71_003311 [Anisodus tanguticus]|uniref:Uncharacterized protein n=1 Tax=Anisodus tanguticus TaxID=243964 RepID=A0AAE1SWE7_9SOLA|nr:hypothetical protein RND71_003311 [Anisodus tanguticus]